MGVIIVPRTNDSSGGGSTENFPNASVLRKLNSDSAGNLTFNGKTVGQVSIESAINISLADSNISAASLTLPEDCDTSRPITLALQGISTRRGVDWEVIEHDSPVQDLISWAGLGLQAVAKQGDSVLITYYTKL